MGSALVRVQLIKGLTALIIVSTVLAVGYLMVKENRTQIMAQAIDRGFAVNCPVSGQFAWKDECSE
jgi:hypothetical protein